MDDGAFQQLLRGQHELNADVRALYRIFVRVPLSCLRVQVLTLLSTCRPSLSRLCRPPHRSSSHERL